MEIHVSFITAEDGGRTRDLKLGKLALCQLSYFRIATFSGSSAVGYFTLSPKPLQKVYIRLTVLVHTRDKCLQYFFGFFFGHLAGADGAMAATAVFQH